MAHDNVKFECLPPPLPSGACYLDRLSPREMEVAFYVFHGYSNRQIAALLSLNIKTIEKHRANVMRKLGVESFALLMRVLCREEDRLQMRVPPGHDFPQ